jgi:hypothetical protein
MLLLCNHHGPPNPAAVTQHTTTPTNAGVGYIAFAWMHNGPEFLNIRTPVGLSDPVCEPRHFAAIARAFVDAHPQAAWAQVSALTRGGGGGGGGGRVCDRGGVVGRVK